MQIINCECKSSYVKQVFHLYTGPCFAACVSFQVVNDICGHEDSGIRLKGSFQEMFIFISSLSKSVFNPAVYNNYVNMNYQKICLTQKRPRVWYFNEYFNIDRQIRNGTLQHC